MSSTADPHTVSYLAGIQDKLVWDCLILLDAEIQLIWKAPWKFGKLLYFLTRYLAFAGAIIQILCRLFLFVELNFVVTDTSPALSDTSNFLTIIVLYIAEIILSLRVWALWDNSRKVACLIAIFLVPALIYGIVTLCLFLYGPHSKSCSYGFVIPNKFGLCPSYPSGPYNMITMFIYLMVYEAVMLAMTIYKAREHGQFGSPTSFIITFFLHGLTYNVIALSSEGYLSLLIGLQVAMHSILTSRMLLHIRQEAKDTALSESTTQLSQSLHFAPGPLNDDEIESTNTIGGLPAVGDCG
ncbi:hypothetical protein K435DRAFT_796678 [Dendrothele bispora CBS 962.96]|uniref:DUF6533 domain-containing protein n=1 Tax=Dendrothele bispora (strain CBS 962.96) TaxID=1314807 RepID=A0A4S8M688_DENBC|nr:hypothetical protein K435DRAFT_796678 [Dendrothele bispora CBS 962.96]